MRYVYRGPVKATPDDGACAEALALTEGAWDNCIFRRSQRLSERLFIRLKIELSTTINGWSLCFV